jgi:hypothetical protein
MANGKTSTWPDGSPRSAAPLGGPSSGSTKDGHAVRRADGWSNSDAPAFGWLKGTPAAKSDPQGAPAVEYGPSSKLWNRRGK